MNDMPIFKDVAGDEYGSDPVPTQDDDNEYDNRVIVPLFYPFTSTDFTNHI